MWEKSWTQVEHEQIRWQVQVVNYPKYQVIGTDVDNAKQ